MHEAGFAGVPGVVPAMGLTQVVYQAAVYAQAQARVRDGDGGGVARGGMGAGAEEGESMRAWSWGLQAGAQQMPDGDAEAHIKLRCPSCFTLQGKALEGGRGGEGMLQGQPGTGAGGKVREGAWGIAGVGAGVGGSRSRANCGDGGLMRGLLDSPPIPELGGARSSSPPLPFLSPPCSPCGLPAQGSLLKSLASKSASPSSVLQGMTSAGRAVSVLPVVAHAKPPGTSFRVLPASRMAAVSQALAAASQAQSLVTPYGEPRGTQEGARDGGGGQGRHKTGMTSTPIGPMAHALWS